MRSSMLTFVAFSLVLGFTAGFIDNAAHVGGLAGGYLMGMVMAEKFDADEFRRQGPARAVVAIVLAALLLGGVWSLLVPGAA